MTIGDASVPLHRAVVAKLKADGGVMAIVGDRVYDDPPPSPVKPYITLGPMDVIPEVAQEYEGSETSMQVDAWVAGPGGNGARQLGRAIRAALHEANLTLTEDQRLISLTVEMTRYLEEPDGVSKHVAVTLSALTEPSA